MAGLPFELVSFCEKLAGDVTSAGQKNGWRVQQFGRQGFNTDVIVGSNILKITTGGKPGADGSGAVIRFGTGRSFTVRLGGGGTLELSDDTGATVSGDRFVELVGEACGAPIKTVAEYPTPLVRFCEQLGATVVTAGQANGWQVQAFGSRGFNCDVMVGSTVLKLTTEGTPAPDGTGALVKLKRPGYENILNTRIGKGNLLELADATGQAVSFERLIELIAEGCGVSLAVEAELSPALVRFCEMMAGTIVKAGQDNGWKMRLFGKHGVNADAAVGLNIVKVTTEVKPGGAEATLWIKGPAAGEDRSFSTKAGRGGELDLINSAGAHISTDKFIEILAKACGTPIKEEQDLPNALVRLCENTGNTIVNAGNDNGWKVLLFGKKGVNADVAFGPITVKVNTTGKPAPDGSGVTVRIARPGWERNLITRLNAAGDLEFSDAGNTVDMARFIELVAEACNAQLQKTVELPASVNRFYEKVASTVASAGNDTGWKVQRFGSKGFNADLSVGTNVIKVSTEGTPAPDGSGIVLRVKRPGFEKALTSRMGRNSELEAVDESGSVVSMDKFVEVLKAAGKF